MFLELFGVGLDSFQPPGSLLRQIIVFLMLLDLFGAGVGRLWPLLAPRRRPQTNRMVFLGLSAAKMSITSLPFSRARLGGIGPHPGGGDGVIVGGSAPDAKHDSNYILRTTVVFQVPALSSATLSFA